MHVKAVQMSPGESLRDGAPASELISTAPPRTLVRLISPAELKSFGINFSRMWLYRQTRAGRFPAPVRLGGNRIAYREDELVAWLEQQPRGQVPMSASQSTARTANRELALLARKNARRKNVRSRRKKVA